jgi:Domain of unknown function (DUF1841)
MMELERAPMNSAGNPKGSSDPNFNSAMRQISRATYAEIWRRGLANEEITGEDAAFFEAMQQHPEYAEYFERAQELADREVVINGVNPYLHIAMHTVIEKQVADRDPPESDQALFRLTRAGIDRHEAIHRIAYVFTQSFWEVLQKNTPFDIESYRRRLRAIKP